MKLEIVKYPDERLRLKSEPVSNINKNFIEQLAYTMFFNKGLGISAIQVGRPEQIFLVDGMLWDRKDYMVFINPEITFESPEKISVEEGCLSFPGLFIKVKRAKEVHVKALDINGNEFSIVGNNLIAQVLQHEYDHLTGKLFIDMASFMEKKKISKLEY